MDMKLETMKVLEETAAEVSGNRKEYGERSCGRVICEALAEAAMKGDIKACALLMELAGEDVRSREYEWKHMSAAAANDAPVIMDVRPE